MADFVTTREANTLADNLSQCGGQHSLANPHRDDGDAVPSGGPAHSGNAAAGSSQRRVPTAAGRMIHLAALASSMPRRRSRR